MKTRGLKPILSLAVFVLAIAGFGLILFTAKPTQAATGINQQLNFQGRLLTNTGAIVADGTYNMEFKIYQDGTGCVGGGSSPCSGTLKWTEDWVYGPGSGAGWQDNRVTVKNGYFSANLGAICSLTGTTCNANQGNSQTNVGVNFNSDTLWLSINIGNTTQASTFSGASGDGEMLPFKRLTSTPYAFNANNLGGLAASNFVQLAQGVQTDTNTSNPSIFINKNNSSGTPNIIELQKAGVDALSVDNSGNVILGQKGTGGANGSLVFSTTNASNTTITISAASTGSSYSLTLPTTGPAVSQCLQTDSSTASQLKFASCGGSVAFNNVTAGTNASALVVGTGGSLTTSGTGTITATGLSANYVASITDSTGITGGNCSSSACAATVSVDQTASLTWTGTETFNGAFASTPSGTNNFVVNGDNDSNVQVNNTLTSDVTQTGLAVSLTDNASASTGTVYGLSVINNDNGANTGVPDAVAYIKNANAGDTVPDGLLIENSGSNGGLTNGLEIKRTNGSVTNGLTFTGSFGTNLINSTVFTVSILGDVTGNSYNGLTLTRAADGFTIAGGVTSRTLTVTGANITVGSTITPTAAGGLTVQSNGANTLLLDTGGNAAFNIGTTNAGGITIGNTSNATATFKAKSSTSAFQFQNSSGANLINVDSSASLSSSNLVANPSFETTISGSGAGVWVKKSGSETTFANDTTQFYNQLNSLKITTHAAAGDGAKQQLNTTLSAGTSYNVIFYVKLDAASATMTNDLQAGFSDTGADTVNCSNTTSVIVTGWTKYNCSFTTGTSANAPTSSNFFFINQTDAAVHTFYVDAVLLQLSSSADANYRDSLISLDGVINTPLIVQNTQNSANAFQVQNASGGQVFTVDSTDANLLNNPANPSFEVNTAGWTTVVNGGTVTIARDTSKQKFGIASLLVTTSANTAQGARYTLASGSWAAGTYTVSFSMLNSGTAFGVVPIVKFGNGSDNACNAVTTDTGGTAPVPSTSGWTRYAATCTFSGTTTSIAIEQNEATAHTFYIDAVQLESGSSATVYGLGAISISGQIITPTHFKNQSNSTNAFQVQNTNGDVLLGIDTLNTTVNIGENGTVATASTVNIANTSGSATQTVNIGNTSSSSQVFISGGGGATAISLQTGANGTITMGNTAGNGNTVNINIGSVGATLQNNSTVSIATNSNATESVTIGNTAGTDNVLIRGGSTTIAGRATTGIALQTVTGDIWLNSGNNVVVGTSDTTGTILVLDTDTDAAFSAGSATNSSTEVDGGMFYSSTNHLFMCGTSGSWLACDGLLYSNTSVPGSISNCTTACGALGQGAIPANYCKTGRTFHVTARGIYTTSATTIQFGLYYGSNSAKASDTLIGSATQVSASVTASAWAWQLDFTVICFSTTSMQGQSQEVLQAAAASTTSMNVYASANSGGTVVTTTAANNFYIFPAFGAAAIGDNATLEQLIIIGN